MSREIPSIDVSSWDSPLDDRALSRLAEALPAYITTQRWYRAKARIIKDVRIQDVISMEQPGSFVAIVRIDYRDHECDTYFLPLSAAEGLGAEPVARLRSPDGSERVLQGALSRPDFRESLLEAIACDSHFHGKNGLLAASRNQALHYECNLTGQKLESFVSRAEQSNSSLIFGDRFILKVFRKLEPGINPDLEIGRFLTARGFKYTPAVLGELEYRPTQGEPMHAGILQAFVRNQGDAWKYTLDSLKLFFELALRNDAAPGLPSYHPMDLYGEEISALARQTIGEYLEAARLLGVRTAQMHAALADPDGGPDFAPEKFTPDFAHRLYAEMLTQAETTFDLLRDKQNTLPGSAGESARQLIASEKQVRERFSSVRDHAVMAVRIRHHGDYHLGQVLYTGEDFIIIDFEGEPARPMAERRVKTLAMRDVAGMARSFSYAAYVALEPAARDKAEPWAAFWAAWVAAVYLKGYFETAQTSAFANSTEDERRLLFDVFTMQKALYEISYELNNRPDWLQIPLQGILNLIG